MTAINGLRMAILGLAGFAVACDMGVEEASRDVTVLSNPPPNGSQNSGNNGQNNNGGSNGALGGTGSIGTIPSQIGQRTVQEADIYDLAGNTLYILNAYRGLEIVDVTNPSAPAIIGRVPVVGSPRDIYVEGNTAYVLVSDSFDYDCGGYQGRCGWQALPGITTQIVAVDITTPSNPVVLGNLEIPGDLQDSRIVGTILYVVSDSWPYEEWQWSAMNTGLTYVASIDVSNPAAFTQVAELDFPFDQWDTGIFLNVSDTRIILAEVGDNCDLTNGAAGCTEGDSITQFQPIDITSPTGALVLGTPFVETGNVPDRWAMDFDPTSGIFRAVLSGNSPHVTQGGGTLVVYSAPTATSATKLGSVDVTLGDNITAAAFDGSRVYLTATNTTTNCPDPVAILDTTDPNNPQSLGSVAVPGAIDFLDPQGTQLISLGHAQISCGAFQGTGQLAVSLFDVTDGTNPSLLSQVTFGGPTSAVAVSSNDIKKAFLVLDTLGMILVPFQNIDPTSYMDLGGTQIIDLNATSLTLRGMAPHEGLIERAFPVQSDVMAFSNQRLQVIDISNQDQPVTVTELDLARQVLGIAVIGQNAVELSGDPILGNTEIAVTAAATPDQGTPSATIQLPGPNSAMFQDGSIIWVLANDTMSTAWLEAVDVSVPSTPVLRGKLALSVANAPNLAPSAYTWGTGDEAVLVNHVLAIHLASQPAALQLINLSNPDAPVAESDVALGSVTAAWGLFAVGNQVWICGAASSSSDTWLFRIDFTAPSAPAPAAPVPVPNPGFLFNVSADGSTFFTLDSTSTMTELSLQGTTATAVHSATLPGATGGAVVGNGFAYAVDWTQSPNGGSGQAQVNAIDLSDLTVTQGLTVGATWAVPLAAVGGKLFIQTSWNDDTGIMVFDLSTPSRPNMQGLVRTDGLVEGVAVNGTTAYLVSGEYGVPTIDLTPGSVLPTGL